MSEHLKDSKNTLDHRGLKQFLLKVDLHKWFNDLRHFCNTRKSRVEEPKCIFIYKIKHEKHVLSQCLVGVPWVSTRGLCPLLSPTHVGELQFPAVHQ